MLALKQCPRPCATVALHLCNKIQWKMSTWTFQSARQADIQHVWKLYFMQVLAYIDG